MNDSFLFRDSDEQEIQISEPPQLLSVSQLNTAAKDLLGAAFGDVWVVGEVSDLSRPSSGHFYFSLKDEEATIRAVLWRSSASRLPFQIEDGQQLVCRGKIDLYVVRGSYQLVVNHAEPKGVGGLQLAFEQMKRQLAAEGLFDEEHKQSPPWLPRKIAFVTSPSGAAIRDFLEVIRRRWSNVHVIVIPARVQGAEASGEIAAGIRTANGLADPPDLLVVGRGGGSMEDLWCFNEEEVVRAIFDSAIPVISAVGHEIDVTLSDLVADRRALTPSEAAELAVPSEADVRGVLEANQQRLVSTLQSRVLRARQQLETLALRPVLNRPEELIEQRARLVDDWEQRLKRAMHDHVGRGKEKVALATAGLNALNPLGVLQRGYSVTQDTSGNVIQKVNDVQDGQEMVTRVMDGKIYSTVVQSREEIEGVER
ncbi:MAG: exodeoxyribonuclease VII large subunit [Rhodopirellula sp.]|nr:exodeoxyribonuclease VII large subunit [Rhodopirellula sp.]